MKRTLTLAMVAAATSTALLVPHSPAAATTAEGITLKVGQTLLLDRAAITGVSTAYQAKTGGVAGAGVLVPTAAPADCAGEAVGCEVIPITFPVADEDDPDRIEAEGFILEVTLNWDAGQTVDNLPQVGVLQQNRLEGYLFQNPMIRNANGTPNFTASSNGSNPANLLAVNPTSNKFELVIANMHGVNNGYTLQLSLSNAKAIEFDPDEFKPGSPGGEYVQPTFPTPASRPQDAGFGGSVAPTPPFESPTAPSVGPLVASPIRVPNIANGSADSRLLSMSKQIVPSGLGKTGAVDVVSKVSTVQAGKSSSGAVTLGLLVLPVLAIITGLLLARRGKKDKRPIPAAA